MAANTPCCHILIWGGGRGGEVGANRRVWSLLQQNY